MTHKELIAEAEKHTELVTCGNPRHTNFEVGCPECESVCDFCTCPWPCDARLLADALEAATTPLDDDREALARVLRNADRPDVPGYLPPPRKYADMADAAIDAGFHRGAPQADEEVYLEKKTIHHAYFGGIGGDAARLVITRGAWKDLGESEVLSVSVSVPENEEEQR